MERIQEKNRGETEKKLRTLPTDDDPARAVVGLVLGLYREQAVGIELEPHVDLRDTSRSGVDSLEMKGAEKVSVLRLGFVALVDL